MSLVSRGRLSVQPVEEDAWSIIELLAQHGGWDEGANKKEPKAARSNKTPLPKVHKGKSSRPSRAVEQHSVEVAPALAPQEATSEGSRRSTRSMVRSMRSSRAE